MRRQKKGPKEKAARRLAASRCPARRRPGRGSAEGISYPSAEWTHPCVHPSGHSRPRLRCSATSTGYKSCMSHADNVCSQTVSEHYWVILIPNCASCKHALIDIIGINISFPFSISGKSNPPRNHRLPVSSGDTSWNMHILLLSRSRFFSIQLDPICFSLHSHVTA